MPYILAVSGLKDSGKTTLCGELLTRLRQKGHTVGYVKHSSHSLRSPENTDTGKMLKLGIPVVHFAADGVLMDLEENPPLEILLAQYFLEKDLVLLEGGKHLPLPRIWVGAPETVPPEVKGIIAYWNPPEKDVPDSSEYGEGGENRLVERIEKLFVSGEAKPVEIFLEDRKMPIKGFVGDFIAGGIRGMLRSLKGYSRDYRGGISLFLKKEENSGKESS